MKTKLIALLCAAMAMTAVGAGASMNVLILTGSNNHNWQETTPVMKDILEKSDCRVDVVTEPEELTAETLAKYDVVLSNWNNWGGKKTKAEWSDELRKAYVDFVRNGGGHVMIHAGSSSFFDWDDYQDICCATWEPGKTGHGKKHEFDVRVAKAKHPVTQGLKPFKTTDELWHRALVRPGVRVLTEAYSSATENWEPSAMAREFGKGRCFALLLGHGGEHMENAGFQELLTRGTKWAAGDGGVKSSTFSWERAESSVALRNGDQTVWRFYYGDDKDKPFFHPLALVDGTELTDESHQNHPWHHALWFSWKYINGVNFWEESKQTGKAQGKNAWSDVKVTTRPDHTATIAMNLSYTLPEETEPILKEKRTMVVSAPDGAGTYAIDWESAFTACSSEDVVFDRTPIEGEPKGVGHGGYAGLSVRFKWEATEIQAHTEQGQIDEWTDKGRFNGEAWSADYSALLGDKTGGIAIFEHPDNLNAPTSWYVINAKLKYYSPAVIFRKPHTLAAGETMTLKYRVYVHEGRWGADALGKLSKEYKSGSR